MLLMSVFRRLLGFEANGTTVPSVMSFNGEAIDCQAMRISIDFGPDGGTVRLVPHHSSRQRVKHVAAGNESEFLRWAIVALIDDENIKAA